VDTAILQLLTLASLVGVSADSTYFDAVVWWSEDDVEEEVKTMVCKVQVLSNSSIKALIQAQRQRSLAMF